MNTGTKLRVVGVVGVTGTSGRLPAKATKDFCGRPLAAWTVLQMVSSHLIDEAYVIGDSTGALREETEALGAVWWQRPEVLEHPIEDSGGIPTRWGVEQAAKFGGPISIVLPLLLTNPLRKPDDFDNAIKMLVGAMGATDRRTVPPVIMSASVTEFGFFETVGESDPVVASPVGSRWINTESHRLQAISTIGAQSYSNYMAHVHLSSLLLPDSERPTPRCYIYPVEWWQQVHIDDQDQFDLAEFWMRKKILIEGDEYERYAKSTE